MNTSDITLLVEKFNSLKEEQRFIREQLIRCAIDLGVDTKIASKIDLQSFFSGFAIGSLGGNK